jgi:hypothetical protein
MTIFAIENQEFGWDEIVAAAQIWGEWNLFAESVRQSLACLRQAAQTHQLPSTAKMREVATEFRYARNLISAEETHRWLERWNMTVEDWMNCLRGRLLKQIWAAQLTEITRANPISDAEVERVVQMYAVCGRKLESWASRLAGHAAVAANPKVDGHSSRELIARIEAEFERKRQQSITMKLIETKIAAHRLDWIHYDCRYLWFDNESVGREAAWCVSEDGLTLDQVAADAHDEVRQWSFYADEIEASVRPYFLAARQGDLVGPLKLKLGYPLFSLLNKKMPHVDDPQVVSRAERAIVTSLTTQAINERVKWGTRFAP